MAAATTPFDERILWWYWRGVAVRENSIAELAQTVRTQTPNVAGIAVKSSNGALWQGEYDDPKRSMAIVGPESLRRWADVLAQHDLELHLWCVVHGQDVPGEARRIIEACAVPGVRSMILDVEAGERYFGSHPPEVARDLITRVRSEIPADCHLGLCFFARGDEPAKIHIDEWLPHVQSLHPMVYHWDFSNGTSGPQPYLDEAFERLAPYELPIVPILGTYPDPDSGKPVPEAHMVEAAHYALAKGAAGISYFVLSTAVDGCAGPPQFSAIRQVQINAES